MIEVRTIVCKTYVLASTNQWLNDFRNAKTNVIQETKSVFVMVRT